MDPLSKLPVECLHLIFQVLTHNNDTGSLAALLQTNRYIASIALVFLYDNPYQLHLHSLITGESHAATRSENVLSHMLLSQLASDTLSPVISHALRLGPYCVHTAFPSKSPLDYFAQIRHLRLPAGAVDVDYFWPKGRWQPETDAFMNGPELNGMRKTHNLVPVYDNNMGIEQEFQLYHFQVLLWREALWALASPIFEQLQSMTVPVFDLDRYSRAIGRLGNLEHIHFALDDIVDYTKEAYYVGGMVMSDEFRAAAEARKERSLRAMVQFVRDHAQLFPGSLKAVNCELWPDFNQTCPVEVELEILGILPPLQTPTSLSRNNFLHLSAHLKSTDLRYVQDITDLESPSLWFNLPRDGCEFLQRCRALRSIQMDTLGPGSFTWAVQERRDKESLGNNSHNISQSGIGVQALEGPRPAYLEYGLVPLEEFDLWETEEVHLSDETDDVVFAFSQTLKKLTVTAATSQQMRLPRTLHFGSGWVDLPVLTTLYLTAAWNILALDIQLYRHCPCLTFATLTDNSTRYQLRDIVTCLSAELPRLDTLDLIGWSALSFHPDSLYSTAALKKLSIAIGRDDVDSYYIPPDKELDRSFGIDSTLTAGMAGMGEAGVGEATAPMVARPLWTWDWQLPELTSLTLTAEFAYRFQFRMLQGCPALESISLNIRTSIYSPAAQRVLTMSELFMPWVAGKPREAIVAHRLKVLRFIGSWRMDDTMLEQFFIKLFPKLENFEEEELRGYDLENLVDVVRHKAYWLEEMHLSYPEPHDDSAERMGLICADESEEADEEEDEEENTGRKDRKDAKEEENGRAVSVYLGWRQYSIKKKL
ncbi:MAG: hypothetical protein J3R72DRAFT_463950 [Linnemannia gamsii]|nr:MAG: hypothetical protein J3R72DRAFT_463950 [Linnemannia gamsii]